MGRTGWRARAAGAALALALVAACGGPDDDGAAGEPSGPGTTGASTPADSDGAAGSSAPATELGPFDFVAERVQGGQVVGAELVGADTVVWFWAPW